MCFSLPWLEAFLVYCIIVGAVIAILRLVIPWVIGQLGIPLVGAVLNIVLWAVVAIFVIYICFALISCLIGGGGFSLLPHR